MPVKQRNLVNFICYKQYSYGRKRFHSHVISLSNTKLFNLFSELKKLEGLIAHNEELFKCGICSKALRVAGTNRSVNGKVVYFKTGRLQYTVYKSTQLPLKHSFKWILFYLFTAHFDRCVKRRESSIKGFKRIDNYFGLPSNSQQLDDADAIIVNEQTEEFKGVDDIISDK